jgi:zinc/manganese transport system substrate-binding protein
MRNIARWIACLLFLAAVVPANAQERVPVVASFSIIADLVRQVGGERITVTSVLSANADMHSFQPAPSHAKLLLGAKLMVINGLGLEGWADSFVKASGYKGARLVASRGIKALPGGGHGRYDPHAWQKVANVKVYVANIRDALSAIDPANAADYRKRAADYLATLDALEAEIFGAFKDIPKPRRVITSHEAFTYYGAAYDIEFLAPQGVSGETQPSAGKVAQLIRQLKREKAPLFVENINQRLIAQIARETETVIGGKLYSDALSDASGPAPTYVQMMRHNTQLIADALRQRK